MQCATTQDCLAEHDGYVCRKSDGTCWNHSRSVDCPRVFGSYASDDVLLLGAILPLDGPHANTGAALANAIQLGVTELDYGQSGVGGLPPADGGLARPIAVVVCDESVDPTGAAQYLTDELDVPIILGTGESDTMLVVADDETFSGGPLLLSPRATVDLSAYQATGRVWRTCPSDTIEADAISALVMGTLEPAILTTQPAARIALVHSSDTESTELDARIVSTLRINGVDAATAASQGTFLDRSYGDPDQGSASYSDAIGAVTGQAPDVVIVLGSTQAVAGMVGGLEAEWPVAARKPQYVLSSGLQVPELLSYVQATAGTDPSLPSRILGTAPGSNPGSYGDLSLFLIRYKEMFGEDAGPAGMFGVAQAYDALYTAVYAAAFARNTDLIGTDVSGALQLMLGHGDGAAPIAIDFGPDDIRPALAALTGGRTATLNGASAPLAFDPQTGNVTTDVQVWCVVAPAGSSYVFQASGLAYSPPPGPSPSNGADGGVPGSLQGAIDAGCTLGL